MSQRITWWRSSFLPSQNWTQIFTSNHYQSPLAKFWTSPKERATFKHAYLFDVLSQKINMTIGKTPSFIGDTASNGYFSIVILVFQGISIGLVLLPQDATHHDNLRATQTTHLPLLGIEGGWTQNISVCLWNFQVYHKKSSLVGGFNPLEKY